MVLLADVVLVLHFAYVLFVVGGLVAIWLGCALGWRWVRNFRGANATWRWGIIRIRAVRRIWACCRIFCRVTHTWTRR